MVYIHKAEAAAIRPANILLMVMEPHWRYNWDTRVFRSKKCDGCHQSAYSVPFTSDVEICESSTVAGPLIQLNMEDGGFAILGGLEADKRVLVVLFFAPSTPKWGLLFFTNQNTEVTCIAGSLWRNAFLKLIHGQIQWPQIFARIPWTQLRK